jgi:hypothetical protein
LIVDALHPSHADEKRLRQNAILLDCKRNKFKIQNRLDRLYDDRLDGLIESDFFERKVREWRLTQKRSPLLTRLGKKKRPPVNHSDLRQYRWQRIRDSNP